MDIFGPRRLMAGLLAVAALTLTACSVEDTGVDSTACVFNKKNGELVDGPITNGKEVSVGTDEVLVLVPRSVRFWNQSTGTGRDITASTYSEARDIDGRTTRIESEMKFIIHPQNACEFYATNLARYDNSFNNGLQFNVEGVASTGWMQVLARNVDTSMQDAYETILSTENGLLGTLSLPTNANPDGSIPDGDTATRTLKSLLSSSDSELGQLIVDRIADKFNGNYICGVTTDITDPNDCDPVSVTVSKISLSSDYDNIIAGWEATQVKVAQNSLDAANALIDSESFELEEARVKAENDRKQRLAVLAEAAELALLGENEVTTDLKNQREAAEKLALCSEASTIFGTTISVQDCINLLIVDSNQYPDTQILGGSIG